MEQVETRTHAPYDCGAAGLAQAAGAAALEAGMGGVPLQAERPAPAEAGGEGTSRGRGFDSRLLRGALMIVAIMAAIVVCEYVFAYHNLAYGITIALALTILLYVFLALRPVEDRLTDCVESIALLPLCILFTSSLPWFFIRQDYLLPAVYSCILALCALHIYQKNLSLRLLFGRLPRGRTLVLYLLLSVLLGLCAGFVEYVIVRPAAGYPVFTAGYLLLNLFYMLCFVGLGEELLFRGLIQQDLSRFFGWKWGLVSTALLFTIMHLTWRSVPELLFVFMSGLILGLLYYRSKSLVIPIIVHAINNTMLMAVYPYLLTRRFF